MLWKYVSMKTLPSLLLKFGIILRENNKLIQLPHPNIAITYSTVVSVILQFYRRLLVGVIFGPADVFRGALDFNMVLH